MLKGLVCPYCKQPSVLVQTQYGYMYECAPCDARVGTHKGTTDALGRLANATLRKLKQEAHAQFDKLWREGFMGRREAYRWLSQSVGVPIDYCHIGMFGENTCQKVVENAQRLHTKLQSTLILELIEVFELVKSETYG